MNKAVTFLWAILLTAASNAQIKFKALRFAPQFPKAGQTLNFTYNTELSPLIEDKSVSVVVYMFTKKGIVAVEPKLTKNGKIYSGGFKTDTTASCFAFVFSSEKENDINGGKGYILPVYTHKNEPVKSYYNNASVLHASYGEYLFGMDINDKRALAILEEGMKIYPEIKYDGNFSNYLQMLKDTKQAQAKDQIEYELAQFEQKRNLTEQDYELLIRWHNKEKRTKKADSLTTAMKANFPDGEWKQNEAETAVYKEKDVEKKIELYHHFVDNYPETEKNRSTIDNLKRHIAISFIRTKNYTQFEVWNKLLDEKNAAFNLNDAARNMARDSISLESAKAMSAKTIAYARKLVQDPLIKKPDYITEKQWLKERRNTYAMYADTYASILYKLGEYKEGYPYAKEAAAMQSFKNAEYNDHYAALLEKVQPAANVQKELEQFVKDGTASSKTREILKDSYIKQKASDAGYTAYLTNLEMAAKLKKKEALANEMINETAPKFNLKDLDGNTISLDALRGKLVIVDFWATWCGPCIASMPAMKRVQEKYKDRDDIKIFFVDTWETGENKTQNASDFMKKNNYPFHVLMDNDNKMMADFKVSGIPTKFLIDKKGNIRFKSIGFDGTDEDLIDEVDSMIELASK